MKEKRNKFLAQNSIHLRFNLSPFTKDYRGLGLICALHTFFGKALMCRQIKQLLLLLLLLYTGMTGNGVNDALD